MSKRNSKHHSSAPENRPSETQVNQDAIAELAYRRWIENGCPQGTAEEDWLSAEAELRSTAGELQQMQKH